MVWTAHRYVSGDSTDGGRACIPTLKVHWCNQLTWEVESNADKSTLLQETFFLRLSQEEPEPDEDTYPAPSFHFSPVTNTQIHRIISWLVPYKVPGADGILNLVLIWCADLLVPHLGPI